MVDGGGEVRRVADGGERETCDAMADGRRRER